MTKISEAVNENIHKLRSRMEIELSDCDSLEVAAQRFTDMFYQEFKESLVLIRLFMTVPFENLPKENQSFVKNLVAAHNITELVNEKTLVLSLLGTHGIEEEWNDRHNSKGHVGVPLASSDFIDKIPMMSRLLKELGVDLDWIDSSDTDIVAKTMGKIGGVFHVPVAKTAVDNKGRKIIAAQDFVDKYSVETVFGLGGGYMMSSTKAAFITVIIFLNEEISRPQAEKFMTVINSFKIPTVRLVIRNKIFAS